MTKSQWFDEENPDFPLAPVYLLGQKNTDKNKGMKENNLLSLSFGNIIRKSIDDTGGLRPDSFETYQVVHPGDTVLRFTDLQNDHKSLRSGLVTEKGIITSAYIGFRPDPRMVDPVYFAYTMRALDGMKAFYEMGSGVRQSLNWEEFSALYIPLPDLETQRHIADYLDKEISEMDALIEEFERLVENLGLRRSTKINALINSVESVMVPIGVLSQVKLGKMLTAESPTEGGEIRSYLRAAHIQPRGRLDLSVEDRKMWFSSSEVDSLSLKKNDILIVEGGAGFGRSAILSTDLPTTGFQNSINRVRVDLNLADPKFVFYVLQGAKEEGLIDMVCDTATIPHFTSEKVSRFRIPIPTLEKQRDIADELDREFERMDVLIEESTRLIKNLKARKTALITEVVTGRKEV